MIDGLGSVQIVQLLILILYFLGLLGIGYLSTRVDASMEEYFLADRGLGAWLSGVSSSASSESGWVTLGAVGMGYAYGASAAWFIPGCLLGYCLNWYVVAPRLREISKERSLITLPDFLEDRVNDPYGMIRILSVIIIFFALCAYIGAQFHASGKLFSSLFFDEARSGEVLGIVVGAGFTILYTTFGGFRASAWTDLVQGVIIATGLVLFPTYLIVQMGGITKFTQSLDQQPARGWIEFNVSYLPSEENSRTEFTKSFRLDSFENKKTIFQDSLPWKQNGSPLNRTDSRNKLFQISVESSQDLTSEKAGFTFHLRPLNSMDLFKDESRSNTDQERKRKQLKLDSVSLNKGDSFFVGKHLHVEVETIQKLNSGEDLVDPFGAHNNDPSDSKAGKPEQGGANADGTSPVFPIPASLGFVLGLMGIGLGYPGMPHVLSRFMATRDQIGISQARVIALFWGSMAFYGAVVLGMLARVYLSPETIQDQENALAILATEQLHPVLSGVLISAVLSAVMSTADSMMIIASSAVSRDLYPHFIHPESSQQTLVRISRIAVFLLGLLGIGAAIMNVELIFWFVLVAWAILGASFGPPVILGLCWRGLTKWGVLAGMITGATTAVIWKQMPVISKFVFGIELYELIPAFVLSFLITVLVSILTTPPNNVDERMCR